MVYNIYQVVVNNWQEVRMKSSDLIRELCTNENISVSELVRQIGQLTPNFRKE